MSDVHSQNSDFISTKTAALHFLACVRCYEHIDHTCIGGLECVGDDGGQQLRGTSRREANAESQIRAASAGPAAIEVLVMRGDMSLMSLCGTHVMCNRVMFDRAAFIGFDLPY